ncbi:MAG: hypothetical protein JWO35_333 [Candidatus Saccharibacteria bacterium]|nr:hypothetical protein [Candidatus Saccharibacteria bacterium]
MKYKKPEFIIWPHEAELLELPKDEIYHHDQVDLLHVAIQQAGLKLAERYVQNFDGLRQEGQDVDYAFDIFDHVESRAGTLMSMGIIVKSVILEQAAQQ